MAKAGGCWVSAAGDGVVTKAGWGSMGEGWHVVIDHGNGVKTWYLHSNGQFKVKAGDQVKAGQIIMYMGCTGNCTGTHLHFAFWINGQPKNPENYVKLR
jgi:murein DD-endopeptidase MepM/ murein hydrolase activator NlpD